MISRLLRCSIDEGSSSMPVFCRWRSVRFVICLAIRGKVFNLEHPVRMKVSRETNLRTEGNTLRLQHEWRSRVISLRRFPTDSRTCTKFSQPLTTKLSRLGTVEKSGISVKHLPFLMSINFKYLKFYKSKDKYHIWVIEALLLTWFEDGGTKIKTMANYADCP